MRRSWWSRLCSRGTLRLRQAFEGVLNPPSGKPAELLAKFLDAKMKGGGSGASASGGAGDNDEGVVLDKAMFLFRCLQAKDVFEAFYRKDLAKRLLLGRSASSDAEKEVVRRLKGECGAGYTQKLEGMFKDVEASKEAMEQFSSESAGPGGKGPLDVYVNVLTTTNWPSYPASALVLPASLLAAQARFTEFYTKKRTKGRKLAWAHGLDHCIVRATFPSGRKELDVSLHQALVLLLFADASVGSLTFPSIATSTGIENGELRRVLQSLACGAIIHRVLRKTPAGREVEDGDTFAVNSEFKNNLVRIKINSIQARETPAEVTATHERVVEDRQYQIDAAIVRVMKTRKCLGHNDLLAALLPLLGFGATPVIIKKRIESLIDREYLERTDTDGVHGYSYVA